MILSFTNKIKTVIIALVPGLQGKILT